MKRVLNFNSFMNESVRDKMKPRSSEELDKSLEPIIRKVAGQLSSSWMVQWSKMDDEYAYKYAKSHSGYIRDTAAKYGRFVDAQKIAQDLVVYFGRNINESVRDMMKPKSEEDIIDTFNNADDVVKKKMIKKLVIDKFRKQDEFFDFIRVVLGVSVWGRLSKKLPRHYAFTEDIINKLKKHEANQIFNAIVSRKGVTNESVRDSMKPKSREEVEKAAAKTHPNRLLIRGVRDNIFWMIKNALDRGADIHIDNDLALRVACMEGYIDTVRYLLDKGADVHANNDEALRNAAFYYMTVDTENTEHEIVKHLIFETADVEAAMRYANQNQYNDVYDFLSQYRYYWSEQFNKNESVRDAMKPKSDEDIRLAYAKVINSMNNNSIDKFPDEVQIEFEQIADLFGVPKDDLYLISQEGDYDYSTFEDYFERIVDRHNKVTIKGIGNEDVDSLGDWICYPGQKLAYWSGNDFDGFHAWVFPKNLFSDKLYESVRDLMKPRSKEEIKKLSKGIKPEDFEIYLVDALVKRDIEMIKILLDNGADVHIRDNWPMRYMTAHNEVEIVNLLKTYESVRDLMKPRSKEEIDIAMKNMFLNHPVQFFMKFKYFYDDLKAIFTEEEIKQGINKYASSLFLMANGVREETKEKQLEEFKKIIWYLFTEDYMFHRTDTTDCLWFNHKTKNGYNGGHYSVNGFTKLDDAITYVERMKKPVKYI